MFLVQDHSTNTKYNVFDREYRRVGSKTEEAVLIIFHYTYVSRLYIIRGRCMSFKQSDPRLR